MIDKSIKMLNSLKKKENMNFLYKRIKLEFYPGKWQTYGFIVINHGFIVINHLIDIYTWTLKWNLVDVHVSIYELLKFSGKSRLDI